MPEWTSRALGVPGVIFGEGKSANKIQLRGKIIELDDGFQFDMFDHQRYNFSSGRTLQA